MRNIPGRYRVPLSYIIRRSDTSNPTPNADFLDDYVAMAPLSGNSYEIDSANVYTIIMNLVVGNEDAEAMLKNVAHTRCGRSEYRILVNHY